MSEATAKKFAWSDTTDDRLEQAWGIIANAGQGNWETQTAEWVEAAENWRQWYFERYVLGGRDA